MCMIKFMHNVSKTLLYLFIYYYYLFIINYYFFFTQHVTILCKLDFNLSYTEELKKIGLETEKKFYIIEKKRL